MYNVTGQEVCLHIINSIPRFLHVGYKKVLVYI